MILARFLGNSRGNVAIMFALTAIPLLVAVGTAVDYSRMADVDSKMQQALDSVAVTLASEAETLTADQLNARAQTLFNANFDVKGLKDLVVTATFNRTDGARLTAKASGKVEMAMMQLVGFSEMPVAASAESAWSTTNLRVALVLDNTGSMAYDGKIEALKTATHNLLNTLQKASNKAGDVYVSIIPFSNDVNIGSSNYTKTWLNWSIWDADPYNKSTSCYRNTRYPWNMICTQTLNSHSTWNGCVKDRDKNYNVVVDPPTTTAKYFYPDQDIIADGSGTFSRCPSTLTPLTYDWTALHTAVDAMNPTGPTNQTIGFVWGWQSLMSTSPLNAPAKTAGIDYQDIIILLSDGQNTKDRWDGDGIVPNAAVDTRMATACTNAKTAGAIVYTLLVIDGNETLLQNCASAADKYFKVTDSTQIIKSFGVIGDQLAKLHLSK